MPPHGRRRVGFHQAFGRDLGIGPTDLAILRLRARGLVLTGNSETIYERLQAIFE
jgi:hypothetical protein